MNNELRKYLTVQLVVPSALGERVLRIMPEDVDACLSDDGIMHQANEVLRAAGSEVRICSTIEQQDGKWETKVI